MNSRKNNSEGNPHDSRFDKRTLFILRKINEIKNEVAKETYDHYIKTLNHIPTITNRPEPNGNGTKSKIDKRTKFMLDRVEEAKGRNEINMKTYNLSKKGLK